jgi:hypothetical protein
MEKILITFQTDKEMYEALRKEAYLQNASKSEIIRQACACFFETNNAKSELKNSKEDKESAISNY